jgi:hypothetical protein
MGQTIDYLVTIETVSCCSCGVLFGMPEQMLRARRDDGQEFFCPSGHRQHFTETEAARLRKKLESTERSLKYVQTSRDAARDQLQAAERSRRALKGVVTRQRNRVAAGVCPVDNCRRHFNDLGRHMTTEHPDYAHEEST